MVYCLQGLDGSLWYLTSNREYSVGRKECDIELRTDHSISRKHALLTVERNVVTLFDCGSKYKTWVNNVEIKAHTEIMLRNGDKIQFGRFESIYTFKEINIVTTTSSIGTDQKASLRNNINFLGGSLLQNWSSECTHVTVEQIMLTVKILCALIKGTPIVTLKYWDDYVNNVKQNLPPPDVANYIPACSEVMLSKNASLKFVEGRQSLFKNKIFVFPTKSEKAIMVDLIKLAGGDAISWDTNPLTRTEIDDSLSEFVILQPSEICDEKIKESLGDIIDYNALKGKRTIPIAEIALALINCSCEKDCNPNFDRRGIVLAVRTQNDIPLHTEDILAKATESQHSAPIESLKTELIVPQSLETSLDLNLTDIPDMKDVSQNIPLKNSVSTEVEIISSMKRENDSNETLNPAKKFKIESTPLFTKSVREKNVFESRTGSAKELEKLPGTSKFAFKSDRASHENEDASSTKENFNQFSKKRKAEQNDAENPSKKSIASCVDILSAPSTSTYNENPFARILISKKSASATSEVSATSKLATNSSECQALSSTLNNADVSRFQPDISAIATVDSQLEKSYGWISKVDVSNRSSIKHAPDCNGLKDADDEEMMKYIESFKNAVVIEEESLVVRKLNVTDNNNESSVVNNNVKNFKAFKKVRPLKIQTTIIPEASYLDIICNDKCAIQVTQMVLQNDSDDVILSQKNMPKQKGKRYVLS